jgi:hypothetical protein
MIATFNILGLRVKIFNLKRNIYLIPTIAVYYHKKYEFVIAFNFIGLNIEFWSYNINK